MLLETEKLGILLEFVLSCFVMNNTLKSAFRDYRKTGIFSIPSIHMGRKP